MRAPFGLASIPEIFQKLTNKYFGDIENVTVYFNDKLCATNIVKEIDKTVEEVIDRKKNITLSLIQIKCNFTKMR